MSLRTDIHATFEAIAPSTGGMAERIVETVRREARTRKGMNRMSLRFRVPIALVAAFVLVALVVAVVIGTRLFHSAIPTAAPAGQQTLTALEQLEARPLRLPVYKSILDCHSTPVNQPEGASGPGPIYFEGGSASRTAWGEYFFNIAFTDKVIDGPILVRVADLYKTNQRILFVGPGAAGPIVGTDVVDGTRYMQHAELVLDESQTMSTPLPGWGTAEHRFVWDFLAGVSSAASGGTGWQIDGPGFTEIFLMC